VTEVDNTGIAGDYCSIALDSLQQPHIAYRHIDDGPTFASSARYASFDGSLWSSQVVYDLFNSGPRVKLAINSNDLALIGYTRDAFPTNVMNLSAQTATGWTTWNELGTDRYTNDIELLFDVDDHHHLAVADTNNQRLEYRWQQSGPSPLGGAFPVIAVQLGDISFALDANEVAYFAWIEVSTSDLNFTYYDGTKHASITLDVGTAVAGNVSIAVDSSNIVHISYYDAVNGDLKYARGTYAGGFSYEVVDSNADVGRANDIALDANGVPHIAYYDATTGDLKYAHKGSSENYRPVANAGPDQVVALGDTVTLNGSGSSDYDGDALSYSWTLLSTPAGSAATLSDPTAVNPSFTVDVAGSYVVQLVVNDGTEDSNPDSVTISTP
jgi:hypothetical protein